jgi:hypothetical protein
MRVVIEQIAQARGARGGIVSRTIGGKEIGLCQRSSSGGFHCGRGRFVTVSSHRPQFIGHFAVHAASAPLRRIGHADRRDAVSARERCA